MVGRALARPRAPSNPNRRRERGHPPRRALPRDAGDLPPGPPDADDLTVMITGESGTGKELVARRSTITASADRAVRGRTWRRSRANSSSPSCSAMRRAPSPAPPRAIRAGSNRPRAAPSSSTRSATCRWRPRPACCGCCSRAIHDGRRRVPIKTNVRIVAATNKDLRVLIQQGLFREDLFFRLNVAPAPAAAARARRGHSRSGQALLRDRREGGSPASSSTWRPWTGSSATAGRATSANWRIRAAPGRPLPAGHDHGAIIDAELDAQPMPLPMTASRPSAQESEGLSDAVERHLAEYFSGFRDTLPPPGPTTGSCARSKVR